MIQHPAVTGFEKKLVIVLQQSISANKSPMVQFSCATAFYISKVQNAYQIYQRYRSDYLTYLNLHTVAHSKSDGYVSEQIAMTVLT